MADCAGFWYHFAVCGLVTSSAVSILGAVLAVSGCVGWFRDVLPHEKHESVSVSQEVMVVSTSRPLVARIELKTRELLRRDCPLRHPISAGVKGGLAGRCDGDSRSSLWSDQWEGYLVSNQFVVCGFFPTRTLAQIAAFHWDALIIATIVHLICSLLVGLLYGAALPMFPRRPILLGGVIAPSCGRA